MKYKSHITVALAVLCSTLLIVWSMPRDGSMHYHCAPQQVWQDPDVTAGYNFPVYLTQEEVEAGKDSIRRTFQPFLVRQDSVEGQQQQRLAEAMQDPTYADIPAEYVRYVLHKFHDVYAMGIISSETRSELQEYPGGQARIVEGSTAVTCSCQDLLTPATAAELILRADTSHYDRSTLQRIPLESYLLPSLTLYEERNTEALEEAYEELEETVGAVEKGEKIITKGEKVSQEQYRALRSLERESDNRKEKMANMRYVVSGQLLFVLGIMLLLVGYLYLYRRDLYVSRHTVLLIFSLIVIFSLATAGVMSIAHNYPLTVYVLPFAMVPIFVRTFMDTRTAVFVHLSLILCVSLPLSYPYQFVLVQTVGGVVAVYSLRTLTERRQLFHTAFVVVVAMAVAYACFKMAMGSTFDDLTQSASRGIFRDIATSGALLLLAYPLMYLIEKLFGFTSSVTLIELGNTNSRILRRMSKEAQGTFIHSMQVSNLAAEVADKIGANVELVRTGAMYHDIGKVLNPAFFTENQSGTNPHDTLTEEESAAIIIAHVTEGLRLAAKAGLPEVIRDFIETHHGHAKARYFWLKAIRERGEENLDPEKFTYPVRNPFTREQCIVMMADSVEAASRSLKEYTEETITELVNRIVDGQVQGGYMKDCDITFRDIEEAKRVFIASLKPIYHTRIAYPDDPGSELSRAKREGVRLKTPLRFGQTFFGRTSPNGQRR